MDLQDALRSRFPTQIDLKDRRKVNVRPLEPQDASKLVAFFRRLPEEDRLNLKDDVTRQEVVYRWCQAVHYRTVLPVLALHEDEVVADATLHQSPNGWMRHVGKVRVSVDPRFRRLGLSTALLELIMGIGRDIGLELLDAEFISTQQGAIRLFEGLGFTKVAELADHVRDLSGEEHDFRVYTLHLKG